MLNLKDLLAHASGGRWAALFGFSRSMETQERRSVDSARVVGQVAEEGGRRIAQSKGVANGVSTGLSAYLKREPVSEASFSCRIVPDYGILRQNAAEYGRKIEVSTTDFL